jgi:hypothetical protein
MARNPTLASNLLALTVLATPFKIAADLISRCRSGEHPILRMQSIAKPQTH